MVITLFAGLTLTGCHSGVTSPSDRTLLVSGTGDQASYERAFQAARDELREQGYLLERVDVHAGVISTQRSGAVRELNDLTSRQRHYVRVTFSPPAGEIGGDTSADAGVAPLGDRTMLVRVIVERVQRPGWRPSSVDARLTSTAIDPTLDARGLRPVYAVADDEDPALASRIARAIMDRIGQGLNRPPTPLDTPAASDAPATQVAPEPSPSPASSGV